MFVLRLPHISGDHYIIVGRNSLTSVLDKKDESLYKIPIIGLFSTSLNQNKGFKSCFRRQASRARRLIGQLQEKHGEP